MSAELYKQCATIGCNKQVKDYRQQQGKETCFACEYWYTQLANPQDTAVVAWDNGELVHYRLCSKDSDMKGFYGDVFTITKEKTGEVFRWNNVWYQGPIPEALHGLFLETRPLVRLFRNYGQKQL